MLLPSKAEVTRQLRRYRTWEQMMLASPADRAVRAAFEDSGYTLCVLMGKRCAREAADAAEHYLGAGRGATARTGTPGRTRPGPPSIRRSPETRAGR
ncbi:MULTISPECIES: DUF5133 domain-containing protein [unclassified Streptomyces]|uniref:DUF5133 domain-containing protein n=1 Tax=unclassified Streptomyces TaxID=2593676 RepID=UPI003D729285